MSFPVSRRSTACFSVHARADSGTLPRVMALFAKRGLVPASLHAARGDAAELTIDIQLPDLDEASTDHIARCLRQMCEVEYVLTSEKSARV